MSLEVRIQDEIKAAMLAREKVRLEALRAIKAAILLEKTSDGAETISDDAVLKIIMKLVKQRKESAELYKSQNRADLAENELAEASFMEVFLPRQLSEEELESELAKVIEQVGAKGPQDMGKVMGVAARQLAGRADGKAISMAVKKLLQN
ncbi:MAG: GatB/YqeY domain-containing protein [Bacteroidetes bacterium]|uniref:GatB/YqeY domain-containing protein n=1 Tax=Candidatus Egerieousia excrementavium TaxID=2840778 RepID=A0A9D9DQJ9_9BACT|nr:GatB/YqeY domain-containing protein [Candidatus Egerieousia excrementavium]